MTTAFLDFLYFCKDDRKLICMTIYSLAVIIFKWCILQKLNSLYNASHTYTSWGCMQKTLKSQYEIMIRLSLILYKLMK